MREYNDRPSYGIDMVRIGADVADAYWQQSAARRDQRPRPSGADDAKLEFVVGGSGHIMLLAEVGGLGCATAWDEEIAMVRQIADPAMDDETVVWLRAVHMNITMTHCLLGNVSLDEHAPKRILAAAAGRPVPSPSQAISLNLKEIRRLCEKQGILALWATGDLAEGTDHENDVLVFLEYERVDALPYEGTVFAQVLGRVIGYEVELAWTLHPDSDDARELLYEDD